MTDNNNTPQTFTFAPGLSIRAIVKDGQPWFIAKEVCTALGHTNVSKALTDHVDPEDKSNVSLCLRGKASLKRVLMASPPSNLSRPPVSTNQENPT